MDLESTVERFLLRYAATTQTSYRRALDNFQRFIGPGRPLTAVTSDDIARYVQHLRNQGAKYTNHPKRPIERAPLSPWTVYRRLKTVKVFFNWAAKEGLVERSPAANIPNPKPFDTLEGRVAHEDDIAAVLAAARQHSPRDYAVIMLLARSGCRRGDIATMRLPDLELRQRRVFVWAKGNVRVARYFDDETARALTAWLDVRPEGAATDCVFTTSTGQPLTSGAVYQILRRRSHDAGLPRTLNPHSLRHAVGTKLHELGYTVMDIQHYLGHRSWRTTTLYIQVDSRRMREVAQRLGRYKPPSEDVSGR